MSSKRKCRLSPDSFSFAIIFRPICGYYIGTKQQKHKILPERNLSLHIVLTLACLSETKTKHGLLMFAVEVVGQPFGRMVTRTNKVYAICNS